MKALESWRHYEYSFFDLEKKKIVAMTLTRL